MASELGEHRSGQKALVDEASAAPERQGVALWIAPVWKLITGLAAIAIVAVAWLQWETLSGLEKLLHATQRPWVAASVEPIRLTFDDHGGGITLRLTISNKGPVPATDVLATPILLLQDTKQPFKKACSQYGVGGGIGPTLFKDESVPKASTAWLSRKDFGQKFPELVAVCIKYRFANSGQAAQTGYLFAIGRHNPPAADQYVIETTNGTINPPELVLQPIGSYYE